MSGEQQELIKIGNGAAPTGAEQAFEDALSIIISHQYIRLEDGSLYKVVVGSGMGLLASDDISSYCFYKLCDEWATDPFVQQQFGVKLFLRFKDDIFFCLDAERDIRMQFMTELKARARFFFL